MGAVGRARRSAAAACPEELEGLRIAHLSDFHLGFPSRGDAGRRAGRRVGRRPRARSRPHHRRSPLAPPCRAAAARRSSSGCRARFAVLGNHDFALSRDPFSKPAALDDLGDDRAARRGTAATVELRGRRVQIVGVDPRTYRRGRSHPERLADPDADLRILLCHFPNVIDGAARRVRPRARRPPARRADLPPVRRRQAAPGPSALDVPEGLYRRPGGVLHVSPGLGTTFVPFRFFARPEATELVLQLQAVTTRVGRTHRRDSRAGPGGLPRLRLVAVERRAWCRARRLDRRPRRSGERGATSTTTTTAGLLGSMQYGPAALFPRAWELPAGPPSEDAAAHHVRLSRRPGDPVGDADRCSWPRSATPRTSARRRSRRSPTGTPRASRPTSGSSSTGRCSHGTSSPTSASDRAPGGADRARAARARRLAAGRRRARRAKVLRVVKEAFAPEPAPVPRGP